MKKIFLIAASVSLLVSQTGCFGSFTLVHKVYDFNQEVSEDKFVRTLLFYAMNIIPVYGVASFVDIFLLNLIEFWNGSNPLAMKEGEKEEQLLTYKGEVYKITATKNKLNFKKVNGDAITEVGNLEFSNENQAWSFKKEGESIDVIRFNSNNTVDYQTFVGFQTFSMNNYNYLLALK